MCVLAFAWRAHPRWRLVLAGNRDERHDRPALPLRRWPEASHVLAGRDLESGGSWLGVSEQGRLAVVTNISGQGPPKPEAPSRGALVADFLLGEGPYATPTDSHAAAFNPFHLIAVDREEAVLWRNRPAVERRVLPAGVHGLSNGDADRPWPKTLQIMDLARDWLAAGDEDPMILLTALRSETPPPGAEGLVGGAATGLFLRRAVYGTRCSTVILVDEDGRGRILERRFDESGAATGDTALAFAWPLTP